jgi:hypothetical protein
LPSSFWLVVSGYLLIAVLVLARAQFRTAEGVTPGPFILCFIALVFAAAWPLRVLRRALRLFDWSS